MAKSVEAMAKQTRKAKSRPLKPRQLSLIKAPGLSYGGILSRTRKGRQEPRPLATKESIHLVLRSSQATGDWSFRHPKNKRAVLAIVEKFAKKYAVHIISFANVGNHLHIHLRLAKRQGYKPFIRAITGAIAMAVSGFSRWKPRQTKLKFWDYRPFTRVVRGFQAFLKLRDYIQINFWESQGLDRQEAQARVAWRMPTRWRPSTA